MNKKKEHQQQHVTHSHSYLQFHVIETPKQLKLNVMALCSLLSNVNIPSEVQ